MKVYCSCVLIRGWRTAITSFPVASVALVPRVSCRKLPSLLILGVVGQSFCFLLLQCEILECLMVNWIVLVYHFVFYWRTVSY